MNVDGRCFREVWAVDFEYAARSGDRPDPLCMVASELVSGRMIRQWRDELHRCSAAPFDVGPDSLVVAFYSSAEAGCFLSLGWPLPVNVLDLFAEFRNHTNGRPVPCGNGLLGALAYFGIDGIDAADKDSMRQLALRGGSYTDGERRSLLAYCESDVHALAKLLPAMTPHLDLPRALLRGRYMMVAARIEHMGTPIDTDTLADLRDRWHEIKARLIERIDADYGVFDGPTFKADRFAKWLTANGIPWPRLPSGSLALDDDTFREMARSHPIVAPIRELRVSLSALRLEGLAVGADGRNRCMLSAFGARTGRNTPSNTAFVFGPAVWLRSLIRPEQAWGLAYVDWSQQEFGIAAALSGDQAMMDAYRSGDPYLAFAKQAGAVPADATKSTHGGTREQFKAACLAVQYGMGWASLADRIGQAPVIARELLRAHRETYAAFWRWSDAAVDQAMLRGLLQTVFGWTIHIGPNANRRSIQNFPMQGNGAEMLRLACIAATERGVRICAPVHDAVLIEAPQDDLDHAVAVTRQSMSDASAAVLDGFRLRTDAKLIRHPDRFNDRRGAKMWETVQAILRELGGVKPPGLAVAPMQQRCSTNAHPSSLIYVSLKGSSNGPRPEAIEPAERSERPAQTQTTDPAANPWEVPSRTDSVGLARGGESATGQDAACSDRDLVSRGRDKAERGFGFDDAVEDAGRVAVGRVSSAYESGSRQADPGYPPTWCEPDCGTVRFPEALTDADLRESWLERAAIMEIDGRLPRENAEARALAIVLSTDSLARRQICGRIRDHGKAKTQAVE